MDDAMTRLSALYHDHGPDVLRYLRRRFAGVESPEDLLHETFVQALRSVHRLHQADSPRAWLFAIAHHVGVTALRRRRTACALPDELPAKAEPLDDPRLDRMRQAIAALPTQQRQTLELRLNQQLSYEQISHVLGVPIGTVRSRLHHAVQNLRRAMTDEPESNPSTRRDKP